MRIAIHPSVLGVENYLSYDSDSGSYTWSAVEPPGTWIFGDVATTKSLDILLGLYNMVPPIIGSKAHLRAFQSILQPKSIKIPWHNAIPAHSFHNMLKDLVIVLTQALEMYHDCAYGETFIAERAFIQGLSRASVDRVRLHEYIKNEQNPTLMSILKSFLPIDGNETPQIVYDQLSTATGRLIVKRGPMILTLSKKYRNLLTSSYKEGNVIQLDFVSLEPRVAKMVSGSCDVEDLYSDISEKLFDGSLARNVTKLAVLCALYGASPRRLQNMLGAEHNAAVVIREIRRYFKSSELEARLIKSFRANGHVTNFFGRKLVPDKPDTNILFSHYVQSTAADVALLGFQSFIEKVDNLGLKVKPIFVIHDALIIDVAKESLASIREAAQGGIHVDGMGSFPVSIEVIRDANA
jgi:hypothetical protein